MSKLSCERGRLQLAVEAPTGVLEAISKITDYDFVIGSVCMKDPEYLKFFYNWKKSRDRYLILDNGVFEEGVPIENQKLIELAKVLQADEVVAPDFIWDADKTMKAVSEFCSLISKEREEYRLSLLVQACVQGRTLKEWRRCYEEFAQDPRIDVIALPYYRLPEDIRGSSWFGIEDREEATRLWLVHYLISEDCPLHKPIHLLGLRSSSALIWYTEYPFIRSVDTSLPTVVGMRGNKIHLNSPKSEREERFFDSSIDAQKFTFIYTNVLKMLKWCGDGILSE